MVSRGLVVAGLCALIAACKPAPPSLEKTAPPPVTDPADLPISDFSGDFDLIGTEPFWNLKLRDGKTTALTLTRPDSDSIVATAPGAEIQSGVAVWRATTEGGLPLIATVRVGECSDGMSDRTYAMSAEVSIEGRILVGCATRPAQGGD